MATATSVATAVAAARGNDSSGSDGHGGEAAMAEYHGHHFKTFFQIFCTIFLITRQVQDQVMSDSIMD